MAVQRVHTPLVAGGLAEDAGVNGDAKDINDAPLFEDQRSRTRFFGDAVDIGAFELSPDPGFTVTPTAETLVVSESGTTVEFVVRLTAPPPSSVVLTVSSDSPDESEPRFTQLLFSASNWETPQTVPISGVDDQESDGNQSSIITIAVKAAVSDLSFRNLPDQQVNVLTIDDEEKDPILIITGGQTVDLSAMTDAELAGVHTIDIRGSDENDHNTLVLNVSRILSAFSNGTINVLSNTGDTVVFDAAWEFKAAELTDGNLTRRFEQTGATLNLVGPEDFTNPINRFDVNAQDDITSLDALLVINELSRRAFSDAGPTSQGLIRDVTTVDLGKFWFFDVTRDLRITALDALQVINELSRRSSNSGSAAQEYIPQQVATHNADEVGTPNDDPILSLDQTRSKTVWAGKFDRIEAPSRVLQEVRTTSPEHSELNSALSADLVDSAISLLWGKTP